MYSDTGSNSNLISEHPTDRDDNKIIQNTVAGTLTRCTAQTTLCAGVSCVSDTWDSCLSSQLYTLLPERNTNTDYYYNWANFN
jgi:hypothetical protein